MKRKSKGKYVPDRGDIVWIDFSPQRGHEQGGRRPAVVLSGKSYNTNSNLAILCPITSRIKGYTFEVFVRTKVIQGVALADQVKSFDLTSRKVEFADVIDSAALDEVTSIATDLIGKKL